MKKKVLAITMAALMAASLTACGGGAKLHSRDNSSSHNSRGEGRGYHGSREQG